MISYLLNEKDMKIITKIVKIWNDDPETDFKKMLRMVNIDERTWMRVKPKLDVFMELLENGFFDGVDVSSGPVGAS